MTIKDVTSRCFLSMLTVLLGLALPLTAASQSAPPAASAAAEQGAASGSPIRLRQPPPDPAPEAASQAPATPSRAGEFETYAGLPRFGADLVNELAAGAADHSPVVPPDYVIQVGDELLVHAWGSVDADLRLTVDRSGRVQVPRVGSIAVAGTRNGDLQALFNRRFGQTFKGFELNVGVGKLRGIRVYVTGFVGRPGAYVVAGLSTVMNAVMRAGGPSAGGSFRLVELRRDNKLVGTFDLYDFLLRGDRNGDRLVQPDDVIHVPPVGAQVALRGSVNRQAIFEVKPTETLDDLLRMAGGFSPVADRSRVALERVDDRNGSAVVQLDLPAMARHPLVNGDRLRAYSAVDATLSVVRQNKRVRVEGEVRMPGDYVLPPNSTVGDAIRAAGGTTSAAFLYAATLTRESVRATQQENLDRALRDLETDLLRTSSTQRVSSAEEATSAANRSAANARLIDRLRALQPTGRVVFQIEPGAQALPDIVLESGDRLLVPSRPTTVGVFGSVFNTGNYLHADGRSLDDYLRLAGGPTKGADESSVFVVRANGQVISSRQQNQGWFARGNQIGGIPAQPGDTVFVPEEFEKTTFIQHAKDWTQILYQLGIGLAGINTLIK